MSDHGHELPPGTTCEACKRKIPYPRRESSPLSKTFSYRVPADEAVAHKELLDECQRFVGLAEQPFSVFRLLSLALWLVIQDEDMRGFGRRAA